MEQQRLKNILEQVKGIEKDAGKLPSPEFQAALVSALINHDAVITEAKIQSDSIHKSGQWISESLDKVAKALENVAERIMHHD